MQELRDYRDALLTPKKVFERISTSDRESIIILPFLFFVLLTAFDSTFNAEKPIVEFVISLLLGAMLWFLVFSLASLLIQVVGNIWGQKVKYTKILNVVLISASPYGLVLIYQIIILLAGGDYAYENLNAGFSWITQLWFLGLLIYGLSKVRSFSFGIAFLNILLCYLPFVILGIIISNN